MLLFGAEYFHIFAPLKSKSPPSDKAHGQCAQLGRMTLEICV